MCNCNCSCFSRNSLVNVINYSKNLILSQKLEELEENDTFIGTAVEVLQRKKKSF